MYKKQETKILLRLAIKDIPKEYCMEARVHWG